VWSTFITPNGDGALMQLVVSGGYVVAAGASDGGGDVVSVRELTTGASVWYRETDYCGGRNVLVVAQLVMSIACDQNAAAIDRQQPGDRRAGLEPAWRLGAAARRHRCVDWPPPLRHEP
jgi:hypothetical protein